MIYEALRVVFQKQRTRSYIKTEKAAKSSVRIVLKNRLNCRFSPIFPLFINRELK